MLHQQVHHIDAVLLKHAQKRDFAVSRPVVDIRLPRDYEYACKIDEWCGGCCAVVQGRLTGDVGYVDRHPFGDKIFEDFVVFERVGVIAPSDSLSTGDNERRVPKFVRRLTSIERWCRSSFYELVCKS